MTTLSPTPPSEPASDAIEARIAMLRAEAEVAADPTVRAAIQYEIGLLFETERAEEVQAVRQYLSAYNTDPTFAPPLSALIRIFERRRSFHNLGRLYEAQANHAGTADEKVSALVDWGALSEDHLGQPELALPLYEKAIEDNPDGARLPALYLERALFARGDFDRALEVIARRAELVTDPLLKGLLWIEVAHGLEQRGDIEGALSAARKAAMLSASGDRFVIRLEALARRHGAVPELIAAIEARASMLAKRARIEHSQGESDANTAAALYREAARLRIVALRPDTGGDAQGALTNLGKAIELRPGDVALHRDRMFAAEWAGELSASANEARWLLATGIRGGHAAPLYFRVAEEAQSRGAHDEAQRALDAAYEADPNSSVIAAALSELSIHATPGDGRIEAWTTELAHRAESASPKAKAWMLWQAAHVSATRLRDAERTHAHYAAAHRVMSEHALADHVALLREWQRASLHFDHLAGARAAIQAFLNLTSDHDVEPDERSAVLRDWLDIERRLGDDEGFEAALEYALQAPEAGDWAPDLARIHAALRGNFARLATAHESLARRGSEPDAQAAHFCAAARAHVRDANFTSAKAALNDALSIVPGHSYAIALLEEIHRASGDSDALVHLLRERAESERAGRAAETALLLAGAAAESAGDFALARRTYEDAWDRDPTTFGPLLALHRLAERTRDDALMLGVLERLAERENGSAGSATLELAEHFQLEAQEPVRAESSLRVVSNVPELATFAAPSLVLLGASHQAALLDGTKQLLSAAGAFGESPESDRARASLLRELGGIELDFMEQPTLADAIASELLQRDEHDAWALVTQWRSRGVHRAAEGNRADALLALADATTDAQASAELIVHSLRGSTIGGASSDEAMIRATELAESQPDGFMAALAGLEALGEADDPGERAEALGRWLAHASAESAASLRAARGRALAAAGRGEEACDVLLGVLAAEPTDLASWEALRVAARDAERWTDLVRACDELASVLTGELRAALLEEGAAICMDQLEEDAEAEKRLRAALQADGARAIAYGRLHDLLAERGDDEELLALVKQRAEITDDPELLAPLFYELARLHRGIGQREQALVALDNLLMLEPEHVGGLALLVELQVQREAWADAVDALRTLASVEDVPASQKRIARLGAADFLEKKLGDVEGALHELGCIDALGLADRVLFFRMADLAERKGSFAIATTSLRKAAKLIEREPLEVAAIERRVARLWQKAESASEAIAAYRRALSVYPTDRDSAVALSQLLESEGRLELSRTFEASVRRALMEDPTEPELLRALAMVAEWRADVALSNTVMGALVALDVASEDERAMWDEAMRKPRVLSGQLSDRHIAELAVPGFDGAALELARIATETLTQIDKLEPARWGLSRNDLTQPKTAPPIAHELVTMTSCLGAPAGDVWVGGTDPQLFAMIPNYKGRPSWLVGRSVTMPLSSVRLFELGRRALALRFGIGPFLTRDVDEGTTALLAIVRAAGVPGSDDRLGLPEMSRAVAKVMSRGARKAALEAIERISSIENEASRFMFAAHQTLRRGGLVLANDLPGILERVLGERPSRELICDNDVALDLFRFWISPPSIAARRELGGAS
jgi:tetratricopeptide (TPR) repeat protein